MQILKSASYPLFMGIIEDVKRTQTQTRTHILKPLIIQGDTLKQQANQTLNMLYKDE